MFRKFILLPVALLIGQQYLVAQNMLDSITEKKAAGIMNVLASDSLRGRGNGSLDLLKAGIFIGNKFKEYGLPPLTGASGYYISFRPFGGAAQQVSDILEWNGEVVDPGKVVYLHPEPGNYEPRELVDFSVIHTDSCFSTDILYKYRNASGNLLLWTSNLQPDGENFFPELIKIPQGGLRQNILLVYSSTPPQSITLTGVPGYYSTLEYNVVAMLPGKSKPDEVIIFSAHYDHEGIYPHEIKDSIMNGANDDASGVTAILLLADYFSMKNDNERTILFCAFAGEEMGLLGSKDFVRYLNPQKIKAGVNIEMIGVPQYGKGAVFITGQTKSTLSYFLADQLKNADIKVKPEPNENKKLYERSDNYSFVKAGIPAHTIMSSDDDDPCYHKPCDEIGRINLTHMIKIIRGIALAIEGLINTKEMPAEMGKKNLH